MPTNTITPVIMLYFLAIGCFIIGYGTVFFFIKPFIIKRYEEETELYNEPYIRTYSTQLIINIGGFSRAMMYTLFLFAIIILPERMFHIKRSNKMLPKKYVLSLFSKKELILTFIASLCVFLAILFMTLAIILDKLGIIN